MTYEKSKKQLLNKPAKLAKFEKFNKPKERKTGKTTHKCRRCGANNGVIRKYGLRYCRRCFREEAEKLGFKKYS